MFDKEGEENLGNWDEDLLDEMSVSGSKLKDLASGFLKLTNRFPEENVSGLFCSISKLTGLEFFDSKVFKNSSSVFGLPLMKVVALFCSRTGLIGLEFCDSKLLKNSFNVFGLPDLNGLGLLIFCFCWLKFLLPKVVDFV